MQPTKGLIVIDLVFSSLKNLIEKVNACSPLDISDRNSITCDTRCEVVTPTPVYSFFAHSHKLYSLCNYDDVCKVLAQVWLREFPESRNSVNELLLFILQTCIEIYFPLKMFSSLKSPFFHSIHLRNMLYHRECLSVEARRTTNWNLYKKYSEKSSAHHRNCNNNWEKKLLS